MPFAPLWPVGGSSVCAKARGGGGGWIIRTGAGHADGVRVRAVVAASADAGGGSLVGGAAVHWTLYAGVVPLGGLEVAGRASCNHRAGPGERTRTHWQTCSKPLFNYAKPMRKNFSFRAGPSYRY